MICEHFWSKDKNKPSFTCISNTFYGNFRTPEQALLNRAFTVTANLYAGSAGDLVRTDFQPNTDKMTGPAHTGPLALGQSYIIEVCIDIDDSTPNNPLYFSKLSRE